MPDNINNSFLQKSISLKDFLFEFLKWRYFVAVVMALCLLTSIIYTTAIATPLYSSRAKLYVVNKQAQTLTSSDISVSTYLAYDFATIIADDIVIDKVAKELNGKYSTAQIKSFLHIEIPESTRIISVSALTPDAKDSKKIVDSICTVAQNTLVEIMDLDKIEILSEGKVASNPSSPVLTNNILLGLGVGIAISLILILGSYYLDNKISSSKDVEKYLGLTVLATIPYNNSKKSK